MSSITNKMKRMNIQLTSSLASFLYFNYLHGDIKHALPRLV
jgi:hypothetical protein